MRLRPILTLLLLGLATLPNPVRAAPSPVTVRRMDIAIAVRPDGGATQTEHLEQTLATDLAASRAGRLAIGFDPRRERLDILEAYTSKPDGTRIPVDPARIRARPLPGIPDLPAFQSAQQMTVPFPGIAAGDTEVITYRRDTARPLFPGRFTWSRNFAPDIAWDDVAIAITAPAAQPLHIENIGLDFTRTEQDRAVRYAWHYHAPATPPDGDPNLSPWDRLPRLFVSALPDYASLAAAYTGLAEPRAAVTPRLQASADAITAGIAGSRAQAQALYEWVSTHIHAVALPLAAAGVEPHPALAVLVNGIADSNDEATLLAALLKARGIASQPVLVNLGNAYSLSTPPTLAQLDHVILYLPELSLYADPTSGAAPLGTLPFQEYGKPAVFTGGPGDALRQIPLLAPDAASIATTTTAHMELDGAIFGTTLTVATGPAAIALRLAARAAQTPGRGDPARLMLDRLGELGSGSFRFPPPDDFAPTATVAGQFALDPRPGLLNGDDFTPPPGLLLLVQPGDFFLGPPSQNPADTGPTPCYPGRQVEDLALELPEGRAPRQLPRDLAIATPAFTYRAHWEMDGQTLRVHRELVSRIDVPLCAGTLRHDALTAQAAIHRDRQATIGLRGQ